MPKSWPLREASPELAETYVRQGYWTEDTLGSVLGRALQEHARLTFRIWSRQRPYQGTIGDVHGLARRVASGLSARGIGPGDVVAFQIPSWVEQPKFIRDLAPDPGPRIDPGGTLRAEINIQ